jgi:hypothetical protein
MRPEQDVTGNSTVAFPFYLETQASGAIPERLVSATAEQPHPDLGQEYKEQAASVGRCSSIAQIHRTKKMLEQKSNNNSNISKIEILGRERTRREGEYHSIELCLLVSG